MSHFVQQCLTNLPTYLCVASADSLDVSLVKKNPVGRTGEKHTFLRAGDAVKQPQQQSSVRLIASHALTSRVRSCGLATVWTLQLRWSRARRKRAKISRLVARIPGGS